MRNVITKGQLIDGFAIECGDEKRVITYKDGVYTIGCWEGTYDEAMEAISEKYTGEARDAYITKLDDAKDMVWLTDEIHEKLASHKNWHVRLAVAKYSDKYHHILKDDIDWCIKVIVVEYSNKYHEQLKDDDNWYVRVAVAGYSDKYHEQLKDDPDEDVRLIVAEYSDKYHEYLKDDPDENVREAITNYKKENR